jgi:hypothetical protein
MQPSSSIEFGVIFIAGPRGGFRNTRRFKSIPTAWAALSDMTGR